ncbi:hypothetical protein GCM10011363_36460 [Marivita lacus]|uniref:Integrase n=1 Tax=Marivita lacus TaxID=1323742 RepID=A0ABQ1L3R4_9RHOB|nr:tyrosine-type recombinase/integrase [Marivita lacus]GGC16694.1 hypothetical protein GCM10011363_36460 [Marivita lacus]
MAKYLTKRRRKWYATLDIPSKLQADYGGKKRLFKSLGTDSQSEAERLCLPLVALWKAEFEAIRSGNDTAIRDLRSSALEWRVLLDDADDTQKEALELALTNAAEAIEAKQPKAGVALARLATRQWTETQEYIADWLATNDLEAKSIDMKRSDVLRFSERFCLTKDVNRRNVQQWVHKLLHDDGLKPATVRRIISSCRGYWRYLQRVGHVADESDPFAEAVPRAPKKSKAEIATRRKPFTASEVVKLLETSLAKNDLPLAQLIWLGMWTGCRIEELCSIKLTDIDGDRLTVTNAKTEAGLREVPLHPHLVATLAELSASSADGFILSGLTRNKYGDRSNAVGKRFGRLKRDLGFGPDYVFHSIRKTVTTQFDAAGIPESISARVLGHDIPTMTYGLYSGGAPFQSKLEAVTKLDYPLDAPAFSRRLTSSL